MRRDAPQFLKKSSTNCALAGEDEFRKRPVRSAQVSFIFNPEYQSAAAYIHLEIQVLEVAREGEQSQFAVYPDTNLTGGGSNLGRPRPMMLRFEYARGNMNDGWRPMLRV
jgi:hypothetical protein